MKKVYKAHILFTKEKDHFEVFENGYIAVEDGIVLGVASSLDELNAQCSTFNVQRSTLNSQSIAMP
jgi:guanine deaminase